MKKLINLILSKCQSGFGRDVFITTCGQVIIVLITFLNNKIISSRFGPALFTEYSLIHKTASVVAYLMAMSMGIMLPKYLSIYQNEHQKEKEKNCYIAALTLVGIAIVVVTSICIIFKGAFAEIVFNDELYSKDVFPTMLLAAELTLTTLLFAYYRGSDKFIKYSTSQICLAVIGVIIVCFSKDMILMVIFRASMLGLIALCLLWSNLLRYIKNEKTNILGVNSELKILLKTGVPRIPGEVILFSFTTVPLILINSKIGLEEAAAYSVAFGINSAASPLFRYVGLALLPYASREVSKGNVKGVNRKLKYLALLYIAISLIAIVFVILMPELFIMILYSAEYVKYVPVVRIIVLALLPNSMYLLLRNPIDAASDIPINTINLLISFGIMCALICFSNTNLGFAWSIFGGYTVLGVLSMLSWIVLIYRKNKVSTRA